MPAGPGPRRRPRTAGRSPARPRRSPTRRNRWSPAGKRSSGHQLHARDAVGELHRIGHRDENLTGSVVRLPAVGAADVVHHQQVARLPRLACRVGLVHLVEQLDYVLADGIAIAEPRVEGQPVLAVDVDEVLPHLGGDRPLVEERDLVEPTALTGDRVAYDRAAALPGAQGPIGLPLEL